jgi:hypothetical protein
MAIVEHDLINLCCKSIRQKEMDLKLMLNARFKKEQLSVQVKA